MRKIVYIFSYIMDILERQRFNLIIRYLENKTRKVPLSATEFIKKMKKMHNICERTYYKWLADYHSQTSDQNHLITFEDLRKGNSGRLPS